MPQPLRIGTAGWSVPARYRDGFPADGSLLSRYAARLACVEINSCFHRPHRHATYARWAAETPAHFRFAAKLPKEISHARHLAGCAEPLDRFLAESAGLGDKLAVLLLQLPPSFAFERDRAGAFFAELRARTALPVVCEPRHPSWFADEPDALMREGRIARVAADPARVPAAALPGGWAGLAYWRLHGSPRVYYSDYAAGFLATLAQRLGAARAQAETWCIFDNTVSYAALGNALTLAGER